MKKHASYPSNAHIVMSIVILICAVLMSGAARTSEGGARPHAGAGGTLKEIKKPTDEALMFLTAGQ